MASHVLKLYATLALVAATTSAQVVHAMPAGATERAAAAPASYASTGQQRPIPIVVTALPKPTEAELAEKAEEQKEKTESDRWLVRFTAILAVATVVLAVGTGFLWNATRRLVRGAEQTAERQLRAYVSVESATITGLQTGFTPTARLRVKNFGQTPAYALTGNGGIALGIAFDKLPPPTSTQPGKTVSGLPIGATTDQFHVLPAPLTQEMVDLLTNGALTLWVYGSMQYQDAFSRVRTTSYRFQAGGATGVHGDQLAICEDGNAET